MQPVARENQKDSVATSPEAAALARVSRKADAVMEAWKSSNIELGIAMIEASQVAQQELEYLSHGGRDNLRVIEARMIDAAISPGGSTYIALNRTIPAIGLRLLRKEGVTPIMTPERVSQVERGYKSLDDRAFRLVCASQIVRADFSLLAEIARKHLFRESSDEGQLAVLEILAPNIAAGCLVEIALSRAAPPPPGAVDIFSTILSEEWRSRGKTCAAMWRPELLPVTNREAERREPG